MWRCPVQLPSPALSADGLEGQEAAAVAEHVESQLRVAVESGRVLEAPLPLGALASQIYTMVGSGAPALPAPRSAAVPSSHHVDTMVM